MFWPPWYFALSFTFPFILWEVLFLKIWLNELQIFWSIFFLNLKIQIQIQKYFRIAFIKKHQVYIHSITKYLFRKNLFIVGAVILFWFDATFSFRNVAVVLSACELGRRDSTLVWGRSVAYTALKLSLKMLGLTGQIPVFWKAFTMFPIVNDWL
jgi:hypothetical protein